MRSVVLTLVLFATLPALSQSPDKDPAAILEFGAAASVNPKDGTSSYGPSFAFEVTPIENWLEIEAGTTPLFRSRSTEWDTDVIFKKPWTLSRKAEFMAGIGPEWVHSNEAGSKPNSIAGEAALDFMFWPTGKHKFGWYFEPSYDYNFMRGHEQSVGITGGLLVAIP
ncbi:MAG: hypothetical protein ABR957_02290 [Terracidiphilus sp.]|jgi:hypothetical protein